MMNRAQPNKPQQITPEKLQELLTTAVIEGNRPLLEEVRLQRERIAEMEAIQHQMSQNLGLYWQELRNFVESQNSPAQQSGLLKQLKELTIALSNWHSQQQALLDSMNSLARSLNKKLSEEEAADASSLIQPPQSGGSQN